jgi:hypothetical protein
MATLTIPCCHLTIAFHATFCIGFAVSLKSL